MVNENLVKDVVKEPYKYGFVTDIETEKIAKANFYYGQLQIINEIKFSIWIEFHIFTYLIFLKSILANLFLIIWI